MSPSRSEDRDLSQREIPRATTAPTARPRRAIGAPSWITETKLRCQCVPPPRCRYGAYNSGSPHLCFNLNLKRSLPVSVRSRPSQSVTELIRHRLLVLCDSKTRSRAPVTSWMMFSKGKKRTSVSQQSHSPELSQANRCANSSAGYVRYKILPVAHR